MGGFGYFIGTGPLVTRCLSRTFVISVQAAGLYFICSTIAQAS
jgi:hypothetical protein